MAKFDQAFDSSQHKDMDAFDPITPGWYPAKIVDSDIKPTKAGTGTRMTLKMEIMAGEFKGRVVWAGLNLTNPNPMAVEISQKELATCCRAIGVPSLQDTNQLHGIPFMLKVKTKPAKGDYPASNEPAGYKTMEEGDMAGGATMEDPNTAASTNESLPEINDEDIPWGDGEETSEETSEEIPDDDIPF